MKLSQAGLSRSLPLLGEHTHEILWNLRYDDGCAADLKDSQIVFAQE